MLVHDIQSSCIQLRAFLRVYVYTYMCDTYLMMTQMFHVPVAKQINILLNSYSNWLIITYNCFQQLWLLFLKVLLHALQSSPHIRAIFVTGHTVMSLAHVSHYIIWRHRGQCQLDILFQIFIRDEKCM